MKNKAWLVTIIVFFAGVTFSAGNYKVPPTMVMVLKEMNTSIVMGGGLVSMGILAGIILALPAGGIMMKTGPKKLGLFSLLCALIGNVVGGLAPNFTILMLGRLIEGIGFGLIGVVAPAIIAVLFPPEKRGLPMSIWSTWIAVGLLLIFNTTNVLMPAFGWRGNWWFVAILSAGLLVAFAWGVQIPETGAGEREKAEEELVLLVEGFKSPPSWLLGIIFTVFSFGVASLTTFVPTFFVEELKIDVATANTYVSVVTFGMIGGGIVMGFVLNKVKKRSILLLACTIITAIFMCLTFKVTSPDLVMPFMLATGLVYSMLPAVIFTIAPEAATSPATIGITMGIVILGQNIGGFVAPILIGAVVEGNGGVWDAATLPLVVVGIVSFVAALLYAMAMNRKQQVGESSKILSPRS